jgi:hypothetical protein
MTAGVSPPATGSRGWTVTRVRARVAVVVSGVVLSVPYAMSGPGWFREDFEPLRNARVLGLWHAAGPVVTENRPGAALSYSLVFGVLGGHPLVAYGLLTALGIGVALLLLELVGRYLDPGSSLAVVLVYGLMANRSSMSHWISTVHIWVALAALVGALLLVADRRRAWLPAILLMVSALTYAAIAPVALGFLAVDAVGAVTRVRRRLHLPVASALLAATVYGYATTNRPAGALITPAEVLSANVGWGLTTRDPLWRLIQVALLAGAVLALVRLGKDLVGHRAVPTDAPGRLVAVGLGVMALGILPFVTSGDDIDFVSQGDRANAVSGFGAALVLCGVARLGLGALTAGRARAVGTVSLAVVGVLVAVDARLAQDRAWSATARDVRTAVARGAGQVRAGEAADLGPCPITHDRVEGLNNDWDATLALQAELYDARVAARCRVPVDGVPADPAR